MSASVSSLMQRATALEGERSSYGSSVYGCIHYWLLSAKLRCNFPIPHFSSFLLNTPWLFLMRFSSAQGGGGEGGVYGADSSLPPSSLLLINFQLDCLAGGVISIKFPWIKLGYETLSSSCLSNTKFQISFCF